jgi:ectoine hydroxylase-related dioxygenase (phytanoyl-CoA dioxygenase family)
MSPNRVETPLPDKPADGFPKELEEDSKAAKVDSFDSSTVTISEVVASLIKNGGCIIRNVLNPTDLAAIERDVRPHILKDQPWAGEFFPPETRRVTGLVEKSRTFTETVVGNQLYQEVCDKLLTAVDESWIGQTKEISIAPPQINNTIVFSIGPGAKRQELHRDGMNFHTKAVELKSHEDYEIGRDCAVGLFVAGKKTTRENGATRFIPRSHLWKHSQAPNEELAFYVELEPGDGFIMLASCYHGGSANTTVDGERLVYSCFMIKGFYRQVRSSPLDRL